MYFGRITQWHGSKGRSRFVRPMGTATILESFRTEPGFRSDFDVAGRTERRIHRCGEHRIAVVRNRNEFYEFP